MASRPRRSVLVRGGSWEEGTICLRWTESSGGKIDCGTCDGKNITKYNNMITHTRETRKCFFRYYCIRRRTIKYSIIRFILIINIARDGGRTDGLRANRPAACGRRERQTHECVLIRSEASKPSPPPPPPSSSAHNAVRGRLV